jgi:hypothetical protein
MLKYCIGDFIYGPDCYCVVGAWKKVNDWGCNGTEGEYTWFVYYDNTFYSDGSGGWGTWTQEGQDLTFTFASGTTYTGKLNSSSSRIEGTMVSHSVSSGCWYADIIGAIPIL